MDRKVCVCHICGAEVKRFAEHMASAHRIVNNKKERVSLLNCWYIEPV